MKNPATPIDTHAILSVIDAQSQLQNHLAAVLGDMYGLSLNDLLILLHLDQSVGGRLRRAELAERLELREPGVARMVATMVKRGWVTRPADNRDARVGYVMLTTAGHRLARDGAKALAQLVAALFADQRTQPELATTTRLLDRLTSKLPGKLSA
jgi:DNA-binding MarR family transcriptional regulator